MSESGPPKAPKFPMRLDQLSAPKPRPASPARPAWSAEPAAPFVKRTPGIVLRPQGPLHHAAAFESQRASAPSSPAGLGLDSNGVRQRMVLRLQRLGIRDEAVLNAMGAVPRHLFVDGALAAQAYEDTSLPIGLQQTISKPSVVARMIELLRGGVRARASKHLGRVLEVGTGCGYQAAVLAELSRDVFSIERLKPLHEKARVLLEPLRAKGASNVRLIYGDGMLGHAPNAPYDSIIAAAGGERLPQTWLDQLAIGGRLVAPLLDARHGGQVLVVIDRTEAGFERNVHESVHFVPLKSGLD